MSQTQYFLKHLIDAAQENNPADSAWLSKSIESWRFAACIADYGLSLDDDLVFLRNADLH